MIFAEWLKSQKILTKDDLITSRGIHSIFGDDSIEYGGEYGQQLVYTKNEPETPISGVYYYYFDEDKKNNIEVYRYYTDGYMNGQQVHFYRDGRIKSISYCCMGSSIGPRIKFYENGSVKTEEFFIIGKRLCCIEYDNTGNVTKKEFDCTNSDIEYMKKRFPNEYDFFKNHVEKYFSQNT